MKLLIVDNHVGVRSLIRELVRDLASETRECASGLQALRALQEFAPDCVTVDLHMKGMDGLATLEKIRSLYPHVHLIVVSQLDRPALRERARAAGADHYITKDNLIQLREHLHRLRSQP